MSPILRACLFLLPALLLIAAPPASAQSPECGRIVDEYRATLPEPGTISELMAADQLHHQAQRWRIQQETQTRMSEIQQDVTANRAKAADRVFERYIQLGCSAPSERLTAMTAASPGPIEEVIGTYPIRTTGVGPDCPSDPGNQRFEVVSISGNTIRVAWDGQPAEGTFNPADRSFRFVHSAADSSGRVLASAELTGRFIRGPAEVRLDMRLDWGPGVRCTGQISGVKPAPPIEIAAPGTTPGPADRVDETLEPDDDDLSTTQVLLFLFLFASAAGVGLGLARRPRKQPFSLAGKQISAVGSDRSGGYEDSLEYGEGAQTASPAASKAYEALVVGQSAQSSKEEPLVDQPDGDKDDEREHERGDGDAEGR